MSKVAERRFFCREQNIFQFRAPFFADMNLCCFSLNMFCSSFRFTRTRGDRDPSDRERGTGEGQGIPRGVPVTTHAMKSFQKSLLNRFGFSAP